MPKAAPKRSDRLTGNTGEGLYVRVAETSGRRSPAIRSTGSSTARRRRLSVMLVGPRWRDEDAVTRTLAVLPLIPTGHLHYGFTRWRELPSPHLSVGGSSFCCLRSS